MADHPILFSAPMILGLLREIEAAGTGKTQTRRAMPYQDFLQQAYSPFVSGARILNYACEEEISRAPYAKGDRLWCREEHFQFGHWEADPLKHTAGGREKWYFASDTDEVRFEAPAEFRKGRDQSDPATPAWHKRLGRFMFRKHSRLTLYVTEVRVERLQDISEEDARAEGVECDSNGWRDYLMPQTQCCSTAKASYRTLWDSINGAGASADDTWVACYSFKPVLGNIDTLPATHQEAA